MTGPTAVFAGVDLIDGTPVIDLRPYVTRFDRPPETAMGWFDQLTISDGTTPEHLADLSHQPDGNPATTLTDYRTS